MNYEVGSGSLAIFREKVPEFSPDYSQWQALFDFKKA
jgi:hypothetical protein